MYNIDVAVKCETDYMFKNYISILICCICTSMYIFMCRGFIINYLFVESKNITNYKSFTIYLMRKKSCIDLMLVYYN